jgi:hypothetical protein
MKYALHTAILFLGLSVLSVAEPVITCTPRQLRGLPGEPLRLEISVRTDRAVPIQLRIPHIDLLHLNTVEKTPVQRTKEGRYIRKRTVIWQGLEPGQIAITNLTVIFQTLENADAVSSPHFQPLEKKVPTIGIIIEAVEPATAPSLDTNPTGPTQNSFRREGDRKPGRVLPVPETEA